MSARLPGQDAPPDERALPDGQGFTYRDQSAAQSYPRPDGADGTGDTLREEIDEASLGELVARLSRDMSALVRSEVELARVEMKEQAAKAGRAGGLLGGGAAFGYVALILLAFAAAWGLAEVIEPGWAFLVVGAVVAAIAAALALLGRDRLRQVSPVPEQTIETLKEDARWARARAR